MTNYFARRKAIVPLEAVGRAPGRARRGKYNVPKATYNGVRYDSPMEARYARFLDIELKAGRILNWTGQVRLPIVVNGQKICVYIADFKVTINDGSVEIRETKGVVTAVFRIKWALAKAIYERPDCRFVLIKQF